MQNLYWQTSDGKTVNLVNTPFETEQKLEAFVYQHQELLEDVFIFKRQIRSGSHQGIPDMLGVDQDGKICLIELKNVQVTEDVLPQILQYAIWGETNPDSIKALWLEAKNRPENIEINWDALEFRIMVIGPDYRANVLRMSQRIGYAIELLKVTRFVFDKEEFMLLDLLEEQPSRKASVTKGMEIYDEEFYLEEHGAEATKELLRAVSEIEAIVKKHGWNVEKKFNKYYVGFKYGNSNAFIVAWGGTRAWNIQIKVPEAAARKFKTESWELQRYDTGWKQAVLRKTSSKASADELEPLLVNAYEHIRGRV
jgi:hypothetical protein